MNNEERENLWQDRLAEVSDFYNKNGRNPSSTIPEEATLASWFTMQRVRLRSGNMRDDRAALLDAKLPHWRETSSRTDRFGTNLAAYLEFVAKSDRTPVSSSDDDDERKLAIWMSNQKAQARRGEASLDSIAILDEKIPGWNEWQREKQTRASHYPTWDENLALLVKFLDNNGFKPVFECESDEERRLAAWLNNQRRMFRKGQMTEERAASLNKAVPAWNDLSRNDGKWSRNLAAVKAFFEKNEYAPSVNSEKDDERRLARWFFEQKRKAAAGELESRTEEFTSTLPNWADIKAPTNVSSWEDTLVSSAEYYKQNGSFPATTSEDPDVRRMGFWITRNRKYLKDGKLSSDKVAKLDKALPNWRRGSVGRPKLAA
jgi:hypothetical protein